MPRSIWQSMPVHSAYIPDGGNSRPQTTNPTAVAPQSAFAAAAQAGPPLLDARSCETEASGYNASGILPTGSYTLSSPTPSLRASDPYLLQQQQQQARGDQRQYSHTDAYPSGGSQNLPLQGSRQSVVSSSASSGLSSEQSCSHDRLSQSIRVRNHQVALDVQRKGKAKVFDKFPDWKPPPNEQAVGTSLPLISQDKQATPMVPSDISRSSPPTAIGFDPSYAPPAASATSKQMRQDVQLDTGSGQLYQQQPQLASVVRTVQQRQMQGSRGGQYLRPHQQKQGHQEPQQTGGWQYMQHRAEQPYAKRTGGVEYMPPYIQEQPQRQQPQQARGGQYMQPQQRYQTQEDQQPHHTQKTSAGQHLQPEVLQQELPQTQHSGPDQCLQPQQELPQMQHSSADQYLQPQLQMLQPQQARGKRFPLPQKEHPQMPQPQQARNKQSPLPQKEQPYTPQLQKPPQAQQARGGQSLQLQQEQLQMPHAKGKQSPQPQQEQSYRPQLQKPPQAQQARGGQSLLPQEEQPLPQQVRGKQSQQKQPQAQQVRGRQSPLEPQKLPQAQQSRDGRPLQPQQEQPYMPLPQHARGGQNPQPQQEQQELQQAHQASVENNLQQEQEQELQQLQKQHLQQPHQARDMHHLQPRELQEQQEQQGEGRQCLQPLQQARFGQQRLPAPSLIVPSPPHIPCASISDAPSMPTAFQQQLHAVSLEAEEDSAGPDAPSSLASYAAVGCSAAASAAALPRVKQEHMPSATAHDSSFNSGTPAWEDQQLSSPEVEPEAGWGWRATPAQLSPACSGREEGCSVAKLSLTDADRAASATQPIAVRTPVAGGAFDRAQSSRARSLEPRDAKPSPPSQGHFRRKSLTGRESAETAAARQRTRAMFAHTPPTRDCEKDAVGSNSAAATSGTPGAKEAAFAPTSHVATDIGDWAEQATLTTLASMGALEPAATDAVAADVATRHSPSARQVTNRNAPWCPPKTTRHKTGAAATTEVASNKGRREGQIAQACSGATVARRFPRLGLSGNCHHDVKGDVATLIARTNAVVETLTRMQDTELQECARYLLWLLRELACEENCRAAMTCGPAISICCDILEARQLPSEVYEHAAWILMRLASHSSSAAASVIRLGGIPRLASHFNSSSSLREAAVLATAVIGWAVPREKEAIFNDICSSQLGMTSFSAHQFNSPRGGDDVGPRGRNQGDPLEALASLLMTDDVTCLSTVSKLVHMLTTELPLDLAQRLHIGRSRVVSGMVTLLRDGPSDTVAVAVGVLSNLMQCDNGCVMEVVELLAGGLGLGSNLARCRCAQVLWQLCCCGESAEAEAAVKLPLQSHSNIGESLVSLLSDSCLGTSSATQVGQLAAVALAAVVTSDAPGQAMIESLGIDHHPQVDEPRCMLLLSESSVSHLATLLNHEDAQLRAAAMACLANLCLCAPESLEAKKSTYQSHSGLNLRRLIGVSGPAPTAPSIVATPSIIASAVAALSSSRVPVVEGAVALLNNLLADATTRRTVLTELSASTQTIQGRLLQLVKMNELGEHTQRNAQTLAAALDKRAYDPRRISTQSCSPVPPLLQLQPQLIWEPSGL